MARYRLTKPAYIATGDWPKPRLVEPGEEIEVADDVKAAETWIPLDDAAKAAKAKRQQELGFTISKNGVQALGLDGRPRVFAHGGGLVRRKTAKTGDAPVAEPPADDGDPLRPGEGPRRRDSDHERRMRTRHAHDAPPGVLGEGRRR